MKLTRRGFLWTAAAPALLRAASLERHPYLQKIRADGATVMWTTREAGQGAVEFSTDGLFRQSAPARVTEFPASRTRLPFTYYQYEADLPGLEPGAEYQYRVRVDGSLAAPSSSFRTADRAGAFSFVVLGDSGVAGPAQAEILRRIALEPRKPAFILHTGDMAYPNGTFAELEQNHFGPARDLLRQVCLFATPGNHEYYSELGGPFLSAFSPPLDGVPAQGRGRYYSFDWCNAHFVCVDSNSASNLSMLEWLDRDLRASRQFWKIAFMHHPPYTDGHHENTVEVARVRERISPIFERHNVQLVFTGHDHNYQRTKAVVGGIAQADPYAGPKYVVTGGGGGPLFEVTQDSPHVEVARRAHHYVWADVEGGVLRIRAMGVNPDAVLDSVSWAPPPVITSEGVVNAGDYTRRVAAGGIVSIFGKHLAPEPRQSSLPLASRLEGAQVTLNGRPVRLYYVSAEQVNAHIPFDASGAATLRITTGNGSAEAAIEVTPTAPAIAFQGGLPAIAHGRDGSLVTESNPALPGEWLVVYALGLGACEGEVAAGDPAPGGQPLRTRAAVRVRIENSTLEPAFAGLCPGFAGLYQINVRLPDGLPWGRRTIDVTAGAAVSNAVEIPVGWLATDPEPATE
jgi:uncharacterized protein (TIGR03437 family)